MNQNIATIKLAADHGTLKIIKNYTPASETINGVKVEIDFRTDEWDGLAKTVGFYRGKDSYGQLLADGENSCEVPWEVLTEDGFYDINVIGISENCTLTTNRVRLRIDLGGAKNLIEPQAPTPTLYEQLLAMMSAIDLSNYIPLINGLMPQQLMESDPTESMHIATKKYVDAIQTAGAAAKLTTVTLLADAWVGEASPYAQVVDIDCITEYSRVDLNPTVEQLAELAEAEITLITENNNKVVTVYASNGRPTKDYVIQFTIIEVIPV
jgi:hypothetical protein